MKLTNNLLYDYFEIFLQILQIIVVKTCLLCYNHTWRSKMSKITFSSFSVKNFGPFSKEAVFTMKADTAKKEYLSENTFDQNDGSYNLVSYIFGANGSGKSNFCKAFLDFQSRIYLSPFLATTNKQLLETLPFKDELLKERNYFKFSLKNKEESTSYKFTFIMDEIEYSYGFEILNKEIHSEILTRKKKRTEVILSRTSPAYEDIILKSEFRDFEKSKSSVKNNVLCLSMAYFLNNTFAMKIFDAIADITVINMSNLRGYSYLDDVTYDTGELSQSQYLAFLKLADPTIESVDVNFEEKEVEKQKIETDNFEGKEMLFRNIKVDVTSKHSVYDNNEKVSTYTAPFIEMESSGTIKILNILPVLFNALDSGNTVIIDEIENGIHPNLIIQLVDLFYNSEINKERAQLICTTHCTSLIEEKKIRRDQVWYIHKDQYGSSTFNRLSDIKGIRAQDSITKKHLEDAFGKIPTLDLKHAIKE